MINIRFEDPGMFPKNVEVPSWDDVPAALAKCNHSYTYAFFSEAGHPAGSASRELGDDVWSFSKPS